MGEVEPCECKPFDGTERLVFLAAALTRHVGTDVRKDSRIRTS